MNPLFESEELARKYIITMRWGKMAQCPFCGNEKAYIIDNGRKLKCARPTCHMKFSAISGTLMQASNIPLTKWVMAIHKYAETKGAIRAWELEKYLHLSKLGIGNMKDRIDFAWKFVSEKDSESAIKELFTCLFNLKDHPQRPIKCQSLKNIDNISNLEQYRQVQAFARWWLRRATWIKTNQFTADDIIAEAFIIMHQDGIKEYDGDIVSKMIFKASYTLEKEWLKEHPNSLRMRLAYIKQWQRNNIQTLGKWYIKSKIKKTNPDMTMSEIEDSQMINQRRERIRDFRSKYKLLDGFQSHFS